MHCNETKIMNHLTQPNNLYKLLSPSEWWIETETFIKKLRVHQYYKGKNTVSVVAGALSTVKYRGKTTMFELAEHLEGGWSQAPARPLFRQTLMKLDTKKFSKKVGREIEIIWSR